MNNNVVLKRICIFFLGLGIGLVAGHKHGVAEMKERFHNRVMKKAEKSVLPRYEKQPEPFEESPPMRYLFVMLLVGCASVKSVRDEPFIDIDIDGQPRIVHTLESASQIETPDLIGAGDALGVDTMYRMEEDALKKGLTPTMLYSQY